MRRAPEALPDGFTSLLETYPTTMAQFRAWERDYFTREGVTPGPRVPDRPDTEFTALCVYEGTDEQGKPAVVPKAPPGAETPEYTRAVVLVTEGGISVLWAAGRPDNIPIEESPPPTP